MLSTAPEQAPTADRTRVLLEGERPDPVDLPSGYAFAPWCPKVQEECWEAEPPLDEAGDAAHRAACYFPDDETDPAAPKASPADANGVEYSVESDSMRN